MYILLHIIIRFKQKFGYYSEVYWPEISMQILISQREQVSILLILDCVSMLFDVFQFIFLHEKKKIMKS